MTTARRNVSPLGLATLAVLGLAAPRAASAQTVVAPNANATVAGGFSANTAPFNNVSRYQQIYAASQFSALAGPSLVTQIAFRPSSAQTAAFTQSFSNIRFDLSTTTQTVGQFSPTFAANVGANDTVVFSGPLTVSSANAAGPGSTKSFDILVNLTTPFLYNPASGNLVLDIRDSSTTFSPFFADIAVDASATITSLNFVDNSTTAPTGTVQAGGLVTRFAFTPAPEPSQTAALGLGVLGLTALGLRAHRLRASAG